MTISRRLATSYGPICSMERQSKTFARRTDISLLNDMKKARKLAENTHCVDFMVFNGDFASPEEHVENAAADNQQQQETSSGD